MKLQKSSKQESNNLPVKVPLIEASADLSRAIDAFKGESDANKSEAALNEILGVTGAAFSSAVARRICYFDLIDANIGAARKAKEAWGDKVKSLENLKTRSQEYVKDLIRDNPALDFTSPIGGFALKKNPPALHLKFETSSKSLSNTVTLETIEWNSIPQRFLVETQTYSLNTEAIRAALKSGEQLSWAKLEQGERLAWGAI